uniref:Uncharacterized protein n=1 Tax=Physcomitrium patens TaxID=3218 RepID=A0A2K1KKD9_PHYPA|nr:hypothetical protein PHYPA_007925 [Physcomitrium patens]
MTSSSLAMKRFDIEVCLKYGRKGWNCQGCGQGWTSFGCHSRRSSNARVSWCCRVCELVRAWPRLRHTAASVEFVLAQVFVLAQNSLEENKVLFVFSFFFSFFN